MAKGRFVAIVFCVAAVLVITARLGQVKLPARQAIPSLSAPAPVTHQDQPFEPQTSSSESAAAMKGEMAPKPKAQVAPEEPTPETRRLSQSVVQHDYAPDRTTKSESSKETAEVERGTVISEADPLHVQSPLTKDEPIKAPPSDDDVLERAVAALHKGNLAYSTPEKMKTGETAHIVARIGSDKVSISTLEAGMPTDQGTKTATAPTPVSTKMKMTLKSSDFDVTPLSSEEQFVTGDIPTSWQWDIAAKHSGKLRLHLAAVVELNGLSRDFTTVDRDIAVQVDAVDEAEKFVKSNAVWILGVLGTGLAALWAWIRKRKKPKTSGWATP